MICEVLIGATGTGKTSYVLEKIDKVKRAVIYDYQNNGDYSHIPIYEGKRLDKCRIVRSENQTYQDFKDIVEKQFFDKGYLVVCEEASAMFKTNGKDLEFNDFLLSKRHRKVNFILNFHNARQVPPFIMDYCDFVTVKMTMGGVEHLKTKFNKEVFDYAQLCEQNIRLTYTIGVSNITKGIVIKDEFNGETIQDKFKKGLKK